MHPKIIGIIGPIRAGKTTASNYLVKQYGYTLASNSDVLREILSDLSIEATRENLGRLGDAIFKTMGNETIARFRLSRLNEGPIIVDGIRYIEEIDEYRKNPSFRILGIVASDDSRYQRAIRNGSKKDTGATKNSFLELSEARSELDVPRLLKLANKIIVNDGRIEELNNQIDDIMNEWAKLPE